MTTTEFARLVAEMRHAQRAYFRSRSSSALEESKRQEKLVDKACESILDGQKRLFDED